MAEELKGQLAEGIPGSLQVFVKATQEAFNDTTIDVAKLMKMMQDGELKSAKIMPFVAKYYAEAARRGGALDKALSGNRVAMQRLQQTWMNFQNAIFEGGFGESMTKIFNDLATLLSNNGELATNLGSFFGNMIDGAWSAATEVHNAFVFVDRVISYYLDKLGVQGDTMKQIFDWGGYVLGIAIFINGLQKLFNILLKIAGLKGSIALIKDALGGIAGASGAGDMMGPPRPGQPAGKKGGWLGKAGRFGAGMLGSNLGMAALMAGGGYLLSDEGQAKGAQISATLGSAENKTNILSQATGGSDISVMGALLWNSLFGTSAPPKSMDVDKVAQSAVTSTNPFPYPLPGAQQAPDGKITVEIKAGDLRQYIRGVVDENNKLDLNLLMSGGPG